jgi:hypothetical protein
LNFALNSAGPPVVNKSFVAHLDRIVAINAILINLGIEPYRDVTSWRSSLPSYLEFRNFARRPRVKALVAMEFPLEMDESRELGGTLDAECGATSARQKVFAACQLV